jgi:hypothetical protein
VSTDRDRLDQLLETHYRNDETGRKFRSLCCFGRVGVDVSLDVFNQLCILPKTKWGIKLSTKGASVSPSSLNTYFPICGTIGPAWILAILGRKRSNSKGDFVVPPLEELLRRRISLSLDAALALKESSPAIRFFSQDTGFLWQSVDDSFDVNKVYLEVSRRLLLEVSSIPLSSSTRSKTIEV